MLARPETGGRDETGTDSSRAIARRALGLARSSYYYPAHPRDDSTLQEQIRNVSGTLPTYRVRHITAQTGRDYQVVNRKRIRRVMRKMGFTRKKSVRRGTPRRAGTLSRAFQI